MKTKIKRRLCWVVANILRLFSRSLIDEGKNIQVKGAKLTKKEVNNEIKNWIKINNVKCKLEKGVCRDMRFNPKRDLSLVRYEKDNTILCPDVFQASHTTIKSLRGTLDKILEDYRKYESFKK